MFSERMYWLVCVTNDGESPLRVYLCRSMMAHCKSNGIPISDSINIVELLVDEGTRGEWNLQGLPADELSIQNAIIVTRSDRYPLMVDPQGQALNWIKRKEEKKMAASQQCVTTATDVRYGNEVVCSTRTHHHLDKETSDSNSWFLSLLLFVDIQIQRQI